jgi:hypothetical protein
MFSARCEGVEHFLARALPTLRARRYKGRKKVIECPRPPGAVKRP